jgi:integrase/recombinase XerD
MNIKIRKASNKKFIRVYADIYYGTGRREYVNIGRIFPDEADQFIKAQNEGVMQKAINFVQEFNKTNNPYAIYSKSRFNLNSSFLNYFEQFAEEKRLEDLQQYISSYKHFKAFVNNKPVRFHDITVEFAKAFHDYLFEGSNSRKNKKLANNTALSYFEKFSIVLNNAVDEQIISSNPAKKIKGRGKYIQPKRSYLTEAELKKIEKLPLIDHIVLKKAFLFSCNTGIRFGDVLRLKVKDLYQIDDYRYACTISMNKTEDPVSIPLNKKALNIIKDELFRNGEERVFRGLKYNQSNIIINKWIKDAGILKHITFHNSRHSFASNLINKGRQILEIRDLLGHRSVKTTEIYAKTTGERLRAAVECLD